MHQVEKEMHTMLSQEETEMQNYCCNIETDTMKAIKAYIDKEERKRQLSIMLLWGIACTLLGLGIYLFITL